jgi:predicted DNA-binding transcriptional regulator YafY
MDRLFGLVVLLQHRKRLRAEDLASEFGVSRRTIYRDIYALNEAGVPIVSLPGEGYELMEGYFLPPLVFSVAEASALVLGARLLRNQAAGRLAQGTEQAMAKLVAVLPRATREEVERRSGVIDFVPGPARFDLDDPRLAALQQAIREQRVVRLRYHSRGRDETTERDVEPHRLTYAEGVWYLTGYCRLRGGTRSFRVNRFETLSVTAETFEELQSGADQTSGTTVEVRVRVDEQAGRWLRERQHYGLVREEPVTDMTRSGTVMTYCVDEVSELIPWLRSWGPDIEVLSPPELRERLRREAQNTVCLLT